MKNQEFRSELVELMEELQEEGTTGKKQIKAIIEGFYDENEQYYSRGNRSWGVAYHGAVAVTVEIRSNGTIKSYEVR